ncbi:hypothetical protein CDAR_412431 [Caerostris darwini]|uniref:Uncharacterized protein n=1 Tax=Caerostris darwini TaxID=1538125 RepID=A0AAV4R3D0_9ARAC|nr:hypothetical protein CDAR_412431 [Caerostris darwini]
MLMTGYLLCSTSNSISSRTSTRNETQVSGKRKLKPITQNRGEDTSQSEDLLGEIFSEKYRIWADVPQRPMGYFGDMFVHSRTATEVNKYPDHHFLCHFFCGSLGDYLSRISNRGPVYEMH